jgi:CheY-like chemotaxis protein
MTTSILLVDDNPIQAATRRAILERVGYTVWLATSAAQGLDLLDEPEFFRTVRLIITDHLMPEMNGPEFVSVLRQHLHGLPVLVLSGLPDAELEYEGLDVVFRVKPFAPEQLIRLVRALLEEPMVRTA